MGEFEFISVLVSLIIGLGMTVLSATGLALRRRGYDRFFAWYQLITILAWSLLVRRFLSQSGFNMNL